MKKLIGRNSRFLLILFILFECCQVKDGPVVTYYRNGNKEVEGYIKNNHKQGTWKYFDTDGKIEFEINYKDGKKFGRYVHYCSNGQINDIMFYNSNQELTGISKNFYCDGKIRAIMKYINGELDSTQTIYYKSGQIESINQYKIGTKVGKWIFFNEMGDTIRTEEYNKGLLEKVKSFLN